MINSVRTLFLVGVVGSASLLALPAAAKDKPAAKVSRADAQVTALAAVPGARVKSAELEREHGHLVWSFDLSTRDSANVTEIQVDAISGGIVAREVETPADQAREAKADKVAGSDEDEANEGDEADESDGGEGN